MKVLFICKIREYGDYGDNDWGYGYYGGSGLYISAKLISHMLNRIGVHSKVVRVVDNNDIDREVYKYQPTHVIIEALWVVPEKFIVLKKLHPNVSWIVRVHSEVPFLANEGIAMKWLFEYRNLGNVYIGVNSTRIGNALYWMDVASSLLPNYYPVNLNPPILKEIGKEINIGCFGAIRPLKNQLIQAIAAIAFADNFNLKLKFHINYNRVEQKGQEVLRNIRDLFSNFPIHELVEHEWMNHKKFLELLKTMDIGMNVSLSETYSVITGDYVASDLPIVVSPEVRWAHADSKADPNDVNDIEWKLEKSLSEDLVLANKWMLKLDSTLAEKEWKQYLGVK